jgi:hypothetical protein
MDPPGFSLENFDAIGKWRDEADGAAVDASASLPDGSQFTGIEGLRSLIAGHKEDFVRRPRQGKHDHRQSQLKLPHLRRLLSRDCRKNSGLCGAGKPDLEYATGLRRRNHLYFAAVFAHGPLRD